MRTLAVRLHGAALCARSLRFGPITRIPRPPSPVAALEDTERAIDYARLSLFALAKAMQAHDLVPARWKLRWEMKRPRYPLRVTARRITRRKPKP